MAYVDYWNELTGAIPKLPMGMAQRAVNRAWKDIRRKRLWTFMMQEDDFVSPNPITAGTANPTFGSNTVTMDATAAAAINAAGLFPPVTQRQITLATFDPFNIIGWDNVNTLTLDRRYPGTSGPLQTYQIFRCYYLAPRAGFIRWWTVKDCTNGYFMRLHWTRDEFDRKDPQRQANGNAYLISAYKYDPVTGWPMFEFWPWPLNPIVYNAIGLYDPGDFVLDTDTLPQPVSEVTLMERARYYAYEWAEANKGRFPELRSTSWTFLMGAAQERFKDALKDDDRMDEETFVQNFIQPNDQSLFLGPIDAKYAQSHDVSW